MNGKDKPIKINKTPEEVARIVLRVDKPPAKEDKAEQQIQEPEEE